MVLRARINVSRRDENGDECEIVIFYIFLEMKWEKKKQRKNSSRELWIVMRIQFVFISSDFSRYLELRSYFRNTEKNGNFQIP